VQCFAKGERTQHHDPATHPFRVIEQNSVPIYDKNWGADEELLLIEGAEIYGLGSWADIADHIGGYRTKEEVQKHYEKIYLNSPNFPLPKRASPHDTELSDDLSREEFQVRKKRRIEEQKAIAKAAPAPTPKAKQAASVPSCHEIQGYMPGRLEFEMEYANEAEEAVQHMQFDPGEGINPLTGQNEPEMDLKLTVMNIYNSRLTQRAERKKVIFEHNLLDYRKNAALDKKRTKEERDLLNKAKPFARMMNHDDFEEMCKGFIDEHNLRQAVSQLQDWRSMKIGDLKSGEKYEQEKVIRAQKAVPMGSLDRERYASSARSKQPPVVETPSGAAALVAPELPASMTGGVDNPNPESSFDPSSSSQPNGTSSQPTNGTLTNGSTPSSLLKPRTVIPPIPNITAMPLSPSTTADLHLLTPSETELCKTCRVQPKPYLVFKETILKEALKGNGTLKKKQVRELTKLDPQKAGRVFDFFVASGWIGKA